MTAIFDSLRNRNFSHDHLRIIKSVDKYDHIFSDWLRIIFQWIFYSVLCQLVDIFGIISNIINIICFVKQGFHDTVNISLL
ncbi:unnamed protein product, partial [Candidula unifasciata]